jgi:putative FmdB family regulatory protein
MPTYQYKCAGCGNIVERVRGINESETPGFICDNCNSTMKRYYGSGAFGVQFNGTGWASKDK